MMHVKIISILYCVAFMTILTGTAISAELEETLRQVDTLHGQEKHERNIAIIEDTLDNGAGQVSQARLYWRLARARFNDTDFAVYNGLDESEAIERLQIGRDYAQKAVERFEEARGDSARDTPDSEYAGGLARALFWKTANMGKRGQLRGVLNSLFIAGDMHEILKRAVRLSPGYSNSYYILGQLYEQIPHKPWSFGDDDWAVNIGRKAIALHEEDLKDGVVTSRYHDYYLQLASHLWERNWDPERRKEGMRRKREVYRKTSDPIEQACNYEAVATMSPIGDREEARQLVRRMMELLGEVESPTIRTEIDLEAARELADDFRMD